VIATLSLIAAIVAVFAAYQVARRQDRQQRAMQEREERQQRATQERQIILTTCDTLSSHLTKWHDALRTVVKHDDSRGLEDLIDNLEEFKGHEEFQGALPLNLWRLQPYRRCDAAVQAVRQFEATALEFKERSASAALTDMIKGKRRNGKALFITRIRLPKILGSYGQHTKQLSLNSPNFRSRNQPRYFGLLVDRLAPCPPTAYHRAGSP